MFDWLTDAFSFDLDVAPDVEVNADYAESLRDAEMTRLATIPEGISSSGAVQSDYDPSEMGYTHTVGNPGEGIDTGGGADEGYTHTVDDPNTMSAEDAATAVFSSANAAPTVGSGTQQQASAPKDDTFDKVMATLQKNPRVAAALIQGASGLIAGAGAGYAAKNKQEWEDKKIQEAWKRRRLEAKPGTVRKENWGGLIQTAKG